ncbi:Outer membrane porin protein [Pandoraea iniqua]|uniref:Outer membrane porin protein n=1 Tax=Pandoraea iniqua TaxID=2508288 RepID=A0A5E4RVU7_9BURK|nr:porin [Pandoraea iniqua]VVD66522.1 Outer membrane porin protein [Pandoraea iniqua]
MKYPLPSLIAAAAGVCFASVAPSAFAQSNVTLYGVLDAAVVMQTNTSPQGGKTFSVQQGGEGFLSGSRFGLTGSEDLGGGMKARFVLENGLTVNNGGFDQQGQLFGRQAFVGLSGAFGEVDIGRQYTGALLAVSAVDPLSVGAPATNSWQVYLTGQRFNNALTYTKSFGAIGVNLQYALGGIAGQGSARSSLSGGLSYDGNGLKLTGQLQQTRDTQSRTAKLWVLGAKYAFGPATFYADYLQSQRDAGFDVTNGGVDFASITNMSTPATASSTASIGSVFSAARRDQFLTLGATYNFNPVLSFTGAWMYNNTSASNFGGTRQTAYAILDYRLSKRTDVYVAGAYDHVNGDWSGLFGTSTTSWTGGSGVRLNGHDNQVTYYAGLRHKF